MLVWVPEPVCQTTSGKVIVELAVDHLLSGARDGLLAAGIERAELVVHFGRGAFDERERADSGSRHAFFADTEIAPRALGLRAPIAVGGDLDRTERVGLDPRRTPAGFRASLTGCACHRGGARYFLRNRSSRTTSPLPFGLSGSGGGSGLAGVTAARLGAAPRAGCSAGGRAGVLPS